MNNQRNDDPHDDVSSWVGRLSVTPKKERNTDADTKKHSKDIKAD